MMVNNILNNFTIENDFNKNKLLICNKCLCIPKIIIDPYEHKISSLCPNSHQINSISLDIFFKEELNKEIICSKCSKNSKYSNISYCKNCSNIFCQNCLDQHTSSHVIVKFSDLNVLCTEHRIKNDIICITCNKDICTKCKESFEHRNHKTQTINEFLKKEDNNISSNIKKVLDANIKKEKKQIEIINDMILKKLNKVTEIKNIENKINQRLLNNINIYPNNYNSIDNINNMINYNNTSEENYYETISNITNILDNYLSTGNNGKEKLILIKRKNLKNIFFLIIFLILVIIATYIFGDYSNSNSIYKKNNEKDNNIIFNENSNLLKLSEIIINEKQEKQINFLLIKSISRVIGQYNIIFNYNKNIISNIYLNYKLIYKGSRDGDKIKSFHKRCDNKNNLLFMIESQNEIKFGFFSFNILEGIEENGSLIKDINLFLFYVNNNNLVFSDNSKNKFFLYWHPSLFIEVKGNDKKVIYIPDKFFDENNCGRADLKGMSFDGDKNFKLNNITEKLVIKDIEVFQIFFKNNN